MYSDLITMKPIISPNLYPGSMERAREHFRCYVRGKKLQKIEQLKVQSERVKKIYWQNLAERIYNNNELI